MTEIKIYGEVVGGLEAWGSPEGYACLSYLEKDLKEANGDDVLVRINSVGGELHEGFAMYHSLRRYAKKHDAKIITLAEGNCASIATIIFLAGDERLVTESTSPFVHNAWVYTWGNAGQLTKTVDELSRVDDMIAKHYEIHTDLTKEEALLLMGEDTFISPEECVNIRFATAIEEVLRPMNSIKDIKNKYSRKMNKNEKKGGVLASLAAAAGFTLTPKNKSSKPKAKLISTADGGELDFYELDDDQEPSVGDFANYDGSAADGEFTMSDGSIFVFDAGELTEIKESEEEIKEDGEESNSAAENNKYKQRYENLKKSYDKMKVENKDLKEKSEFYDQLESEVASMGTRNTKAKGGQSKKGSKNEDDDFDMNELLNKYQKK